jgi:hypothetical protein
MSREDGMSFPCSVLYITERGFSISSFSPEYRTQVWKSIGLLLKALDPQYLGRLCGPHKTANKSQTRAQNMTLCQLLLPSLVQSLSVIERHQTHVFWFQNFVLLVSIYIYICLCLTLYWLWGPLSLIYEYSGYRRLFPEVKRPGHETHHSPLYNS